MTLEFLQTFCSTDECRPALMQPFKIKDFTYASDRRIILRVPHLFEAVPVLQEDDPHFRSVLDLVFAPWDKRAEAWKLELPEPSFRSCEDCDGKGRYKECPACHGSSNEYCEVCHERGKVPDKDGDLVCTWCIGSGQDEEYQPCAFGVHLFNSHYLRKLLTLPQLEILEMGADPHEQMQFRFTGGDGILMPMRSSTLKLHEIQQA